MPADRFLADAQTNSYCCNSNNLLSNVNRDRFDAASDVRENIQVGNASREINIQRFYPRSMCRARTISSTTIITTDRLFLLKLLSLLSLVWYDDDNVDHNKNGEKKSNCTYICCRSLPSLTCSVRMVRRDGVGWGNSSSHWTAVVYRWPL